MEEPKLKFVNETSKLRSVLLAGTIISTLALVGPVAAQDAKSKSKGETVIVTGSRIAKRDNVAESPILTVTSEKLAGSGYVAAEQYLNTLPQIAPGLSSQSNNPSSNGRAFLDLRGLGENRNIVLINGRRGQGATSGGVVDINTIPGALVDRVEIISGGAATTYGADAVSGVINFIMKRKFSGVELDSQYSVTEQNDGKQSTTSLTVGGNFDEGRGNAVFSAGYYKRDGIGKGAREFSKQASSSTGSFPSGSLSFGAATPSQAAVDAAFGAGKCQLTGGQGGFGFNPDGTLFCTGTASSPFDVVNYKGPQGDIATAFYPDFFSYNFEPDNLLVLPMERWNIYSSVNYEVNDYFKPYATMMFTNYNADSALAPTPASGSTGFTVPVTNPFLSQMAKDLAATRTNPTAPIAFSKRFNVLGPRASDNTFDVWQLTAGTTGKLGNVLEDWTYDAYWSYGRTVLNETQDGNVRRDRVQALLNAADGGKSLCTGGLNLFGNSEMSDSCKAYISLQAKNLTTVIQRNAEANISGTLFTLPAGDVQTVFGMAYRDTDFDFKPDSGLQPGLVAGFNEQKPVSGYLKWFDLYTEMNVPLVNNLPLVEALSLNLGARTSNNDKFGRSNSYKASLDWKIVDSLRFRGGYQTATRSPSISELYAPQLNNFPTFTNQDPCNTTGTIAATYRNGANGAKIAALCAAQSAVAGGAGFFQPAGQATGIVGGNPDLDPETAKSYTLGLVYRPNFESKWLQNLTATVDYWNIHIDDVIASVDATTIVQRCYNRDGANPSFDPNNQWCKLFVRDQANGGVIGLQQLSRNQAAYETAGVDVALNWGWDLASAFNTPVAGRLNFNIIGTWVEKYTTQTTSVDPVYESVGSIGSSTASATPEWRWTLGTNWKYDKLSLSWQSRYIGEMVHFNTRTGGSATSNTGVPATWYHDLTGNIDLNKKANLRFGVNNLMDQQPRLYTPNVQANTDPSTYDVLGRRYYVGVKFKF